MVDVGPFYLASIVECLGTKALVADEMAAPDRPAATTTRIAQDTIAMAVNDLITVGATPLVVQAYWAAGGSDWFGDAARAQALVAGWKRACDICGVAWGGGETPALAGIVEAGRIDLAASCTGLVNPKERLSAGRPAGAGRRHRAAGLERHPRQRPEPGAQAGRAPAAGLPDRGRAGAELRRGAARADRAVLAGHRGAVARPASRRTTRQHHRPRLAQAAAPPASASPTASTPCPPVPPVLQLHPAAGAARRRARPTAR